MPKKFWNIVNGIALRPEIFGILINRTDKLIACLLLKASFFQRNLCIQSF